MLLCVNFATKQVAAEKKATCSEDLVVCCGENTLNLGTSGKTVSPR